MDQTAPTSPRLPPLLREDRDGVAWLTMNRPRQRNALSTALMAAMQAELDAIAADPSLRVVVIGGAGAGFCAGHDMQELRANPDRGFYDALFAQCSRLMLAIQRLPQPVIARVHGVATAAGCQLVATCDLAVASVHAQFATPGVNIGLFCSMPMVAVSRSVAHKQAMELLLLGEPVDAGTALRFGLINRAVPAADVRKTAVAMAALIASKSAMAVATGKRAYYQQREMGLSAAYDHCSRVMVENLLVRDAEEGIGAFIEKRAAVWES